MMRVFKRFIDETQDRGLQESCAGAIKEFNEAEERKKYNNRYL